MAYTSNLSTLEAKVKGNYYKFKARPGYIVSSGTTYSNVPRKKKGAKQNKKFVKKKKSQVAPYE